MKKRLTNIRMYTLQVIENMKQRISPVPSGSKPLSTSRPDDRDDKREDYDTDENKDRGNWAGRLDFALSLVGSVHQGHLKVT